MPTAFEKHMLCILSRRSTCLLMSILYCTRHSLLTGSKGTRTTTCARSCAGSLASMRTTFSGRLRSTSPSCAASRRYGSSSVRLKPSTSSPVFGHHIRYNRFASTLWSSLPLSFSRSYTEDLHECSPHYCTLSGPNLVVRKRSSS